MVKLASEIWRDKTNPYDPNSADWKPVKADIREWGTVVEVSQAGGIISKQTWAALSTITPTLNGNGGEVLGPDSGTHTDPVSSATVPNEGRYSFVLGAGWTRIGANIFSEIAETLSNLGSLAVLDELPLESIEPIHNRRILGRAGPTDDLTGTGAVYELTPAEGRSVLELGGLATHDTVGLSDISSAALASLRDRSTHTGTQAQSTIDGLTAALSALTAADAAEATTRAAADTAESAARVAADVLYASLRGSYWESTTTIGAPTPVATGNQAASLGGSALCWSTNAADVLSAGVVRQITVGVTLSGNSSGALRIPVMSGTGATATLKRLITIPGPHVTGVRTLYAGVDFEAFTVEAGWVIGCVDNLYPDRSAFMTAETGFTVRYKYVTAEDLVVGTSFTNVGSSALHRINVNFVVDKYYDAAGADAALTTSIAAKQSVEYIKTAYADLLQVWTSRSVLSAAGASTATPLGLTSPLIPAVPGLAFQATLMMAWPAHAGGQSGYAWALFYDANLAVIGAAVVPERTANETILYTTAVAIAPANTAYVQLNGFGYGVSSGVDYAANYASCYIGVRDDAIGRSWYDASFSPLISGANRITVAGDSIASGLSWLIVNSVPGYVPSASNAVGGENVLDTSFRMGAVPIVVKAPVTLPADGSWVEVSYVFGFRNSYTYDASTGAYSFVGKKNTQLYSTVNTQSGGYILGVKSHRDTGTGGSADTDGKIYLRNATGSGVALNFGDDFEIAGINSSTGKIVPPAGVGVVMMGTNGGFSGVNNTSPSMSDSGSVDRLVDLFGRMAKRFPDERMIAVGYYIGGFTTSALRDQYAAAMEQRFGRRFWDMRAWLLGTARNDLNVSLTSADYTSIAAGTVPSIYLIDGTHPRTVVYRAAANRILALMRDLGWIKTYIPLTITLPASLTATVGAATIAVGATTPVTVTPGNSPTADTTVYLYTTSNAAVATVSTAGVVTGVAAGTATITATCRFGGATATVNVTVS